MFRLPITIVVLALISFSYSQVTSSGQCGDRTSVRHMKNFNLERFSGNNASWYLVYSLSAANCEIINYAVTSNVTLHMISQLKNLRLGTNGAWLERYGEVTWQPGSNRRGVLSLVLGNVAAPFIFRVLGTDYVNYNIQYRCINVDSSTKREFLYVMSRRNALSTSMDGLVQRIIRANGLGGLSQGDFLNQSFRLQITIAM
ncbi:uncharacterized protein LOC112905600 [Agrilus planipennis]|uniref:Uncharacterized protein LOC112905600 n=1 Tax=Agrilus planipennis TaxID=224129 RepID=A0A7F5RDN0_AGRPL|nr:uncharacterized protein LOC112905600 [Agrilus planipennis]